MPFHWVTTVTGRACNACLLIVISTNASQTSANWAFGILLRKVFLFNILSHNDFESRLLKAWLLHPGCYSQDSREQSQGFLLEANNAVINNPRGEVSHYTIQHTDITLSVINTNKTTSSKIMDFLFHKWGFLDENLIPRIICFQIRLMNLLTICPLQLSDKILGEMKNPFAKSNCFVDLFFRFNACEYLVFHRLDFLHEMKNSLLKYSVTERVMGILCSGDWAS